MKILNHLFSIATLILLSVSSALVQAQLCPVSIYDSTTGNTTIPCVKTNSGLQLSFQLEPTVPEGASSEKTYWKLASSKFSTCQWAPGACATLDDNFYLVVPVEGIEEGNKHVAGLNNFFSENEQDGFYWQYDFHDPIDTENAVTLKKGIPNPNGGFELLYTLEGDVANFDLNTFYDFQMGEEVIPPQANLKENEEIILRIFHFNDLHNELRAVHKTKGDTHYFAQMVKIVKEARANAADNEVVLFLSAGDDHIGNPFDELLGFDVDSFQIDPAYTAYSAAGLDAAVIGNHELDRGTALLTKAIETNAKFPLLSANLYGSQNLTAKHYQPAIIGMAKGLRIGIIGLTTKQETLLKQKDDPELDAGELLTTLENTLSYVEQLSDVIILLTHVGYNGEYPLEVGDIEIAETAAKMTNKPMVIIGGHLHLPINTESLNVVDKSVPILGSKGSHLGEAIFSLLQTKEGLRSQLTARLIPLKKSDDRVVFDDPD
jgi:5'-nucleotidase / UDP-sugar diphosphatase